MLKEPNTPPTGRAGTYRRQPQGYRAFIPAPLPPDPPVRIEGHLQSLLSRADLALGRLAGSIETLPKPDLFVLMYVRKEAVLSSQIEGTQSSLKDLLAAEARAFDPRQPRDVAEVLNHVAAMNHGLARLSTLCVPVRMIREIHAKLLEGARGSHLTPNELRTSQNWIGPPGCTLNEATFVPPPPAELPDALGTLERFLHAEDAMPLLVEIGLAHAQFETIHPFLNGNGRVGRMLITFLLCEKHVLDLGVEFVSGRLCDGNADPGTWCFASRMAMPMTSRSWITTKGNRSMIFQQVHPGRILKRELDARGLSAAALALKLRIAPSAFRRLWRAGGRSRPRQRFALAASLAVSPSSGLPCRPATTSRCCARVSAPALMPKSSPPREVA